MLPRAALKHEADQDDLLDIVQRSVRGAWRLMTGRNWERAWRSEVGPRIVETVTAGQEAAAATAEAYVASVLLEQGIDAAAPTSVDLASLVGVAGDGREVATALYGGVIKAAKAQYRPEIAALPQAASLDAALAEAEQWLEQVLNTIMADTVRATETVAIAQRPWVDGYVRMLDPKNPCSRCVILAGQFYLFNAGFDRHPECRCVHIPAMEDEAESILTNPDRYFNSLSAAEQDRVFTAAGAEAVRLGADLTQVVNARRGMNTAQQNPRGWIPKGRMEAVQMFGRDVFVTTEGVTKRGIYGKTRGKKPVRLMPESILSIAKDRDDAIRLLTVYGYIF